MSGARPGRATLGCHLALAGGISPAGIATTSGVSRPAAVAPAVAGCSVSRTSRWQQSGAPTVACEPARARAADTRVLAVGLPHVAQGTQVTATGGDAMPSIASATNKRGIGRAGLMRFIVTDLRARAPAGFSGGLGACSSYHIKRHYPAPVRTAVCRVRPESSSVRCQTDREVVAWLRRRTGRRRTPRT